MARSARSILSPSHTRLVFEFESIKLLDYENRWQELENSDNPFAIVVMAHLKTGIHPLNPLEEDLSN